MFKSLDLSLIVEFMLMFYKDKPIDWLLDHIMWVKVCNPEKDAVSGNPDQRSWWTPDPDTSCFWSSDLFHFF